MKRITRGNGHFDLIWLLSQHAAKRGVTIRDETNHAAFFAELAESFEVARSRETLIHGLRAQAMFAYVAAAMGQCVLLKEEDAGEIYTAKAMLRAPDYRIVMADGSEFFVEVKNHRPTDGIADYTGKTAYLSSLQDYARIFKKDLYLAVYWPSPKLWTLVRADRVNMAGEEFSLSLIDAVQRNEMTRLGDVLIATLPSLSLKLYSDPARPRRIAANGEVQFTIGRAELCCGDNVLPPGKETEIGWFLLHYGKWPVARLTPEIEDGCLISMEFRAAPVERCNPDQLFDPVGNLSEMISRQYDDVTAPTGKVDALAPQRPPDSFGVVIPPDFRSEHIPIWRFVLQPAETA